MHQKIFFLACLITSSFLNNINNIILKATGTEISDSNYEISKLCNCDS
jgi:DNA-binding protein